MIIPVLLAALGAEAYMMTSPLYPARLNEQTLKENPSRYTLKTIDPAFLYEATAELYEALYSDASAGWSNNWGCVDYLNGTTGRSSKYVTGSGALYKGAWEKIQDNLFNFYCRSNTNSRAVFSCTFPTNEVGTKDYEYYYSKPWDDKIADLVPEWRRQAQPSVVSLKTLYDNALCQYRPKRADVLKMYDALAELNSVKFLGYRSVVTAVEDCYNHVKDYNYGNPEIDDRLSVSAGGSTSSYGHRIMYGFSSHVHDEYWWTTGTSGHMIGEHAGQCTQRYNYNTPSYTMEYLDVDKLAVLAHNVRVVDALQPEMAAIAILRISYSNYCLYWLSYNTAVAQGPCCKVSSPVESHDYDELEEYFYASVPIKLTYSGTFTNPYYGDKTPMYKISGLDRDSISKAVHDACLLKDYPYIDWATDGIVDHGNPGDSNKGYWKLIKLEPQDECIVGMTSVEEYACYHSEYAVNLDCVITLTEITQPFNPVPDED